MTLIAPQFAKPALSRQERVKGLPSLLKSVSVLGSFKQGSGDPSTGPSPRGPVADTRRTTSKRTSPHLLLKSGTQSPSDQPHQAPVFRAIPQALHGASGGNRRSEG